MPWGRKDERKGEEKFSSFSPDRGGVLKKAGAARKGKNTVSSTLRAVKGGKERGKEGENSPMRGREMKGGVLCSGEEGEEFRSAARGDRLRASFYLDGTGEG